jgi:predicted RNase H-like HicB family nuclease
MVQSMKGGVKAMIESAPEGEFWAFCPEFSGTNGQGETIDEARESLRTAIRLLIDDHLEDCIRGLPEHVIRQSLTIA